MGIDGAEIGFVAGFCKILSYEGGVSIDQEVPRNVLESAEFFGNKNRVNTVDSQLIGVFCGYVPLRMAGDARNLYG